MSLRLPHVFASVMLFITVFAAFLMAPTDRSKSCARCRQPSWPLQTVCPETQDRESGLLQALPEQRGSGQEQREESGCKLARGFRIWTYIFLLAKLNNLTRLQMLIFGFELTTNPEGECSGRGVLARAGYAFLQYEEFWGEHHSVPEC